MSINLLNIAREHLSGSALNLIGEKLNISPEHITQTVGKVFPTLLSSFGAKAKTEEGASALMDLAKNSDQSILSDLQQSFTGDTSKITESGLNALTGLFGENTSSIIEKIGNFSGISNEKSKGLLGLLTPVLTGIIGKQVSSNGLNISGLQSLMKDQEKYTTEILGSGFMEKLGIGSLLTGFGSSVSGLAANTTNAVKGAGSKVVNTTCSTADSVSSCATNAGSSVAKTGGRAVSAVGGGVSKVGSAAAKVGGSAASTIGSGVNTATATTAKAGGGILKFLPLLLLPIILFFLLKNCNGGLGKAINDVGGAAVDGVKSAGGAITDGANAVGEGAKNLGGAAVDGVKSAGGAITDGANAVGEGAKNLGGAAVDGVKSAGEAITDGANAVGEGAKNLGGAAVDGVKSAGGAITDGAKNLGDAAVDGMKSAGDVITDGANAVGEGAKNLGDAAVDGVKSAGDVITDGANAAKEGFAPLSSNVKNFTDKLAAVEAGDETALNKVYDELSADGSSGFLYRIPFLTGETGVPKAHQEALINKLKTASPDKTLVAIGYADVRGDDALNKRLSYGRAKEVSAWIQKTLDGSSNIETFSMGETDRFSKSDYSKNRVVEIWQVAN